MSTITCIKSPTGGLIPFADEDRDKLAKIKTGSPVKVEITQMRNPLFHKKFFALVKFLFDIWSESVPRKRYKGEEVQPSMDRFRKDLTILAGFFTAHYNIRGEVRLEAESISFARMSQEDFEALYSKVIDVALEKVLNRPDLTPDRVKYLVDQLLRYD